ncbi:hypothetical protein EAG_06982, partial [Camponotus floridanus]
MLSRFEEQSRVPRNGVISARISYRRTLKITASGFQKNSSHRALMGMIPTGLPLVSVRRTGEEYDGPEASIYRADAKSAENLTESSVRRASSVDPIRPLYRLRYQ